MISKINKIVIVDPICIGNSGIEEYTSGLYHGMLNNDVKPYFLTHYSCSINKKKIFKYYLFFSENIPDGIIRKIIRAVEYFCQSLLTLFMLNLIRPKIIHFNWMIFMPIDILIIKLIRIFLPKSVLIYTAHNIFPHNRSFNNYLYNYFYNSFDRIIVHGEALKENLLNLFNNIHNDKVFVSHHGCKFQEQEQEQGGELCFKNINLNQTKYFLFFGLINKNKGVHELLKIWNSISNKNGYKLIIAGKCNKKYFNHELKDKLISNDILFFDEFLPLNDLNKLVKHSRLVLLPYINGSVSGVFFTAAQFKKAVLTTNFGSISEYIIKGETSYISNSFNNFKIILIALLKKENNELSELGLKNYDYINKHFNWDTISKRIKNHCYEIF